MNTLAQTTDGLAGSPFNDAAQRERAGTFGMWVFLSTELTFFGPLFLAYTYGRVHWGHAFALASRHTDVMLGTLNTAVLLTSSAVVALAAVAAESGARQLMRRLLWVTVTLGVIFLIIKGMEYHAEWREGLVPGPHFKLEGQYTGGELFFFLYFMMTGLHAVHMLVGICVLSFFAIKAKSDPQMTPPRRIEIGALYWHFVDSIWIFLYPLLYLVERHS